MPSAYPINDVTLNLGPLFAANVFGQGVKVALIDSGIRPGFPHISLDGSVIGGEDLVGDGLGFSNAANNGHGTFMAGMVFGQRAVHHRGHSAGDGREPLPVVPRPGSQ